MRKTLPSIVGRACYVGFACLGLLSSALPSARAEIATLKNGMQFEGRVGKISSMGEDPLNPQGRAGQIKVKQIVFVDDDLRRTFFSSIQTQSVVPSQTNFERILIEQRLAKGRRRVAAVGPTIAVTPFDEWGRRIFSMNSAQGRLDIVQGITEVTPTYTKVEGLMTRTSYVWDMRLATSSLPRDTLSKILLRQIDPKDPDQRLRLVRLYMQSERYKDARLELESVIKDFPALADLKKQVTALYQMSARRLIKEIELRRGAGQDRLAYSMLERFPSEGVAGEVLLQVRDTLDDYKGLKQKGQQTLEALDLHFAAIVDPATRAEVEPAIAEIKAELNIATFDRMADFIRFANDQSMTSDQKIALAVSGWLLGSGSGITNLAVASSLYGVRELVQEYLTTVHIHRRDEILQELQTMEGSSPRYLTMLIAHMKPPVPLSQDEDSQSGSFELTVSGLSEQPEITYFVQLPPEYDPYRRYPCVISLNGAGTTPQQQIDWWAGAYSEQAKMRLGQATRRGYIVIAPVWTKPHQRAYEFTAREHAAVLYPLRDACRRFSIDTDKVFLSGHSMGGDAVWDVGLSHPDLWAGVIPIVATAGKYISRYWENGRYVPFYFVCGDMDGDRMARNSMDLDRYLTHHTYDTIIVAYQGRGHEHFLDEIQRIFDWMDLHRRDFFLREFECVSMRPWDDFFWWAEIQQMPGASIVLPVNWPPGSGVRPGRTEGKILENNRLLLRTAADRATVWLSSEVVDFSKRLNVVINGRGRNQIVEAQAEVLLEDVRTRSDRQHPFSAKVESSTGRGR